ncbi:MAG: CAP domain-containing protein [Candidatus Saccharimonadales bacterium]
MMRKTKAFFATAFISGVITILASANAFGITSGEIIALTNQERAAASLPALNINADLMVSSAAKAQDMINRDYWAHYAPDGTSPWDFISQSGYNYTRAGENLAMGYTSDQDVMTAWMNSPEHRANILDPYYKDIGVAVIQGMLLGQETILVVAHYATPAYIPSPAPVAKPAGSVKAVNLALASPATASSRPAKLAVFEAKPQTVVTHHQSSHPSNCRLSLIARLFKFGLTKSWSFDHLGAFLI